MLKYEYKAFVGIDVSKEFFDVVMTSGGKSGKPKRFQNGSEGFAALAIAYADLSSALIVLETTGGYERELLHWLCYRGYKVHRADTRKVRQFIRSFGIHGKTDALDAKALATYAEERQNCLGLYDIPAGSQQRLQALGNRRSDLVLMLVQEKNRSQAPDYKEISHAHIAPVIKAVNEQITAIDREINALIDADKDMASKRKIMQEVAGVGGKTANALIIAMPELGTMKRRQAASLAGLAPHPCESGNRKGRRVIKAGRKNVRAILFMAAMAARNSKKSSFRAFYDKLIAAGKKPIVAITAIMRKIIVIINAKIRDYNEIQKYCPTA